VTAHAGHELVKVSGRRESGEMVGLLLCMTCSRTVRRLALCGARTKQEQPCRVFVRDDLGYARCWSHGEGAGRTNRPRELRALGLGRLGDRKVALSRRAL
jgi:hypothetical protein